MEKTIRLEVTEAELDRILKGLLHRAQYHKDFAAQFCDNTGNLLPYLTDQPIITECVTWNLSEQAKAKELSDRLTKQRWTR